MYLNRNDCNETDAYNLLSDLFRQREEWEKAIPVAATRLYCTSGRVQAKALWILGEMGMRHPDAIAPHVKQIAEKLHDEDEKIREMAVGAMGRIGRGRIKNIMPHLDEILSLAHDPSIEVRVNFICASENIAITSPSLFEFRMALYAPLLYDHAERVRMEAPEIFKVVGRRKPQYVEPYLDKLQSIAAMDSNRMVRIHARNAIKATLKN